MIKGETRSGFQFEVEENALDNMELVDALAEADGDSPMAVSKVVLMLLGKEQRQKLYDHLRAEDGRVPVVAVSEAMEDVLKAFGGKGKN